MTEHLLKVRVESTGSEYADSFDSNCISIWIRDGEYWRFGLFDTRLITFFVFLGDLAGLVIVLIYMYQNLKVKTSYVYVRFDELLFWFTFCCFLSSHKTNCLVLDSYLRMCHIYHLFDHRLKKRFETCM
jgi:hypothetical protein